jgi:hypothetical protein
MGRIVTSLGILTVFTQFLSTGNRQQIPQTSPQDRVGTLYLGNTSARHPLFSFPKPQSVQFPTVEPGAA